MNTLTEKMTPQQAAEFLEAFDGELVKAAADAVREVGSIKMLTETHEAALRGFLANNTGLLAATNASNFLEGLDKLIFGRSRPSDTTAHDERANYFAQLAEKQTTAARFAHFKTNTAKLATALETIIAARSKNRDACREKLATEIEKLERRERLETSMGEHEARVLRARIQTLEGQLIGADATHREAVRLTAMLRTPSAVLENLSDARGFIANISYDE